MVINPNVLTAQAIPINATMVKPMPVGAEVTGDETADDVQAGAAFTGCRNNFTDVTEFTEVKTFTNSGITAPAMVPHEIMMDNFHHNEPSPKPPISK